MPTYARRLSDQLAADDWLSERIVRPALERALKAVDALPERS